MNRLSLLTTAPKCQELFLSHNASESREQSLHILVSSLKTQSNNQAVTAFLEPKFQHQLSYQNYLTTCIKRHLVLQKKISAEVDELKI